MTDEKKPKTYSLAYTEQEILAEIADLERDDELNLLFRCQKKLHKYNELIDILNSIQKEKENKK